MRSPLTAALLVSGLAVVLASPSSAQASPWPTFQHDGQHTGRTTVTGPTTGHITWQRSLDGEIVNWAAAPVVGSDGSILIGTTSGSLFAFGPDGTRRWK